MTFDFVIRTYYKIRYRIMRTQRGLYYKLLGIEYRDDEQMAKLIGNALETKTPYCVGKIGGNELNAMASSLIGDDDFKKLSYERLCFFAGFFPGEYSKERLEQYVDVQADAVNMMDMLIHYEKQYEDYILKKFKSPTLVWVDRTDAWAQIVPWTKELKGRKVVVCHPFAELIEKQYARRELLYPDSEILPEFSLRVVKAVQSIAGRETGFSSWFEALDSMYKEIMKEDFDIALIGCGAYGLPMAAKVKKAGKIGVHMGGDLQILFGIKGKRWDDTPEARKWYNDAWVRPGDEYTVDGFKAVEDGCYW